MKEVPPRRLSPEFYLLLALLVTLMTLVYAILYTPIEGDTTKLEANAILEYRTNLLSVLLTAFGAWIGAGAAYFFGRENVREAYEGIKLLQQPSIQDKLKDIKIQDIPPRNLTWTVKLDTPLGEIIDQLEKKPGYWFIPVTSDDGKIINVIEDEAVWRYYQKRTIEEVENKPDVKTTEINQKIREALVKELIQWIKSDKQLEEFIDQYLLLNQDQSVFHVNNEFEKKDMALGIVSDSEGVAKFYITTGDIRRTMSRLE